MADSDVPSGACISPHGVHILLVMNIMVTFQDVVSEWASNSDKTDINRSCSLCT